MRTVWCIADAAHDGARVYDVLRGQLGASDGCVRRAKHVAGGLRLDGEPVRANAHVKAGQRVELAIDAPGMPGSSTDMAPETGGVRIVHADADVLVVEKPAGLVMYPSPGHPDGTLANRLAGWMAQHGKQSGLHAVHRLDAGTSGLVAFARNSYAKERLQASLHTDALARGYLAVCEGCPGSPEGTVDAPLSKLSTRPNVYGVVPGGKPAITHYQVIRRFQNPAGETLSLVDLRLETGRTHQIRIHMAHIGCPLAGDVAYGKASSLIARPALHAARLSFVHPLTGGRLEFESPLPADMAALLPPGPPETGSGT